MHGATGHYLNLYFYNIIKIKLYKVLLLPLAQKSHILMEIKDQNYNFKSGKSLCKLSNIFMSKIGNYIKLMQHHLVILFIP